MDRHPFAHRLYAVQRLRWRLERDSFPRLQMLLLVMVTGGSGLLASYLLLQGGLAPMGWRYPAAFAIAYLVFLTLLWLWLRTRAEDYADFPDLSEQAAPGEGGIESASACFAGQGGEFGGGGASGGFGNAPGELSIEASATKEGGNAIGQALGAAAEGDELAAPLIALVLIGAILLSSIFIVYSAPALFAELLVDGTLSASLYYRLRRLERRHWLETALRHTALPFLLTGLLVTAGGIVLQQTTPEAHSLGEALAQWRQANGTPGGQAHP